MVSSRRNWCLTFRAVVSCVALLFGCQTGMGQPSQRGTSATLLDFEDDLQFARLRLGDFAKIVANTNAHSGKRAARIDFAAVPEGVRDYPVVILDGDGLKIRDLSEF